MLKLPVKPVWIGAVGALIALLVGVKLALALASFVPANSPVGYVAQPDITNFNLKSGNEVLFRGQYEGEFWSGTLFAYPVSPNGALGDKSAYWSGSASEILDTQNFDSGRLIATMKDNGTAVPFRFASLSSAQQGYLTDTTTLNFLRGERVNEIPNSGGTLRQRASAFGDVVHARPFYVADSTNPTVFVGSNDGMLHAINAAASGSNGGQERWAYVPSMLLPKMKKLAAVPYTHDYYVDGQVNVGIVAGGTKRVLVGGLGAGGKGLFALNITGSAGLTAATEAGVASKVIWEITPTKHNYANPATVNGFVNLGYTYGTPSIVKVGGVDAVIVGNGYNDGLGDYSGCTHATPNYANCGGNYAAYLLVINAQTGQLIRAIKAGPDGSSLSPNGIFNAVAVDEDGDGSADLAYAGDLNGTMWKIDLTTGTATALLTTSPAQAITSTPSVGLHPNGGFMVNFATGKMLVSADTTDTQSYYAYGVWDRAPVANTELLVQTITERSYTGPAPDNAVTRVRRVTSLQPDYTDGAGHHKGWQVQLSAGERLVGEGSFIENGRFYFATQNPTIAHPIPSTTSTIYGDNWQMELDYLSGGTRNVPFLDLSGNVKLDDADRIKYIVGDTIPVGSAAGDPILTTDGIAVGKFLGIGLFSQPILVQLTSLNDTLYSQNPDIVVPTTELDRGVSGGHFDVEIYYGSTPASAATATLTVGTTGQVATYPATLGAITVNGVEIVPALGTAILVNGTSTSANASAIRSRMVAGFTATRVGNVLTISAPVGASYNGLPVTIAAGTSQTIVAAAAAIPGVRPTALMRFSGTTGASSSVINASLAGPASVKMGANVARNVNITIGSNRTATQATSSVVGAINTSGTIKAYIGGNAVTPTCSGQPNTTVCLVDNGSFASGNGQAVTLGAVSNPGGQTISFVAAAGGADLIPAVPKSGFTDLRPAISTTAFSGGTDVTPGDTCKNGTVQCSFRQHDHEYDDVYDKTGVNFLDPSNVNYNLAKAVTDPNTPFKVLVSNQYLNPAVSLNIGNSNYQFNVDFGYVRLRNHQTSAGLNITTEATYTRNTIGSFAFNMPVDAFTRKDWWGGVNTLPADVRVGLLPTEPRCVWDSADKTFDGNMYRPVNPPGAVTADGNGTPGFSTTAPTTTQLTATGVRHGGALNFQVIKASTTQAMIELSVPGRPEYGWRVKADFFATQVLAEYTTFWHTKHLNICFGEPGWSKLPGPETRPCGSVDTQFIKNCDLPVIVPNGTDPKIGVLGASDGAIVSVTVTSNAAGNETTTVVTYSNTRFATIVRTANSDGSVTITTTDTAGVTTSQTIANTAGAVRSGGDERGNQVKTGRISWRELVAP